MRRLPITICVSRAVLLIPSCLVAKLFLEPTHELTSTQAIIDCNSNFLEFTKHFHPGYALSYFTVEEIGSVELGDLHSDLAFLIGAPFHFKDVLILWFCSDDEL